MLVYIPDASRLARDALSSSWWLHISASTGASLRVLPNILETRMQSTSKSEQVI